MGTNEFVIETRDLRKQFGAVRAVNGVSLQVRRGEVYGFLGPNGSGKTTTIGMILGLLRPSGGDVRVLGETVTPGHNAVLRRVGTLLSAPALLPYLSARENLETLAYLHPGVGRARIDEVLELSGLSAVADRRAGPFSTGMKQRLGLGMALLARPDVLILDEPTNGMDPAGMRDTRALLRSQAEMGTTVFLSSHLLHEVEQVCDRVTVLNAGAVVAEGPVGSLMGKQEVIDVAVPSPEKAIEVLRGLPGVENLRGNGHHVEVSGVSAEEVVRRLTSAGIIPTQVASRRPDLETLFLELTHEAA